MTEKYHKSKLTIIKVVSKIWDSIFVTNWEMILSKIET